jgi:hypothetical protein
VERRWIDEQFGIIPLQRWIGLSELDSEIRRARNRRGLSRFHQVMRAVNIERGYQDHKWGPLAQQSQRSPARWMRTLEEEVEEAKWAYYFAQRDKFSLLDFCLEMVQVAAVAVACLEQLAPEGIDELMRVHREGK